MDPFVSFGGFSMFASAIDINGIDWYLKDDWCLTIGFSMFGFQSENKTSNNLLLLIYINFSMTGRMGQAKYHF